MLNDLASGDVVFAATGVTTARCSKACSIEGPYVTTHSIVMRSATKTVRWIKMRHPHRRCRSEATRAELTDRAPWRGPDTRSASRIVQRPRLALPCVRRGAIAARSRSRALSAALAQMLAARGVTPRQRGKLSRSATEDAAARAVPLRAHGKRGVALRRRRRGGARRSRVFGDYDVDGACASALLLRYLARAWAASRCSTFPTA